GKIDVLRRWFGWKRVQLTSRHKRFRHIQRLGGRIRGQCTEAKISESKKRRLSVELQIVFCFEGVGEDSKTAPHAHLAAPARLPRKTKPRRPIVHITKIRTSRSVRVAREKYALRSVWKNFRLLTERPGESAALQIVFGRTVLVAETQTQRQV